MKITLTLLSILCITLGSASAEPLNVVATLSTFGDLVDQVGGEHVNVSVIAPPTFNPHTIAPKPSDVLRVKKANLYVCSGLDLEVWSDPLLVAASNAQLRPGGNNYLPLSHGAHLLEVPSGNVSRSEGDIHAFGNPHFWHSPENVSTMVEAIRIKLSELLPDQAQTFDENAQAFQTKLAARIVTWKKQLAPYKNSEFIGYHNEWPYLMDFVSCKMTHFLEPKPGIPPGPKHLNTLTIHAKKSNIAGIVHTSFYSARSSKTLAKRTGVPMIILAQGVGENKQSTDYFALMDYNIAQLLSALKGK